MLYNAKGCSSFTLTAKDRAETQMKELKEVKRIRTCSVCKQISIDNNNIPLAEGCEGASIILISECPNSNAQMKQNKSGAENSILFSKEHNNFVYRISDYLLGEELYNPYSEKLCKSLISPKQFIWIHASNAHRDGYFHRALIDHAREHLDEILQSKKCNFKLIICMGGKSAKVIGFGEKMQELAQKQTTYKEIPVRFIYHCSSETREWNPENSKYKIKHGIAQKAIQQTRDLLQSVLRAE